MTKEERQKVQDSRKIAAELLGAMITESKMAFIAARNLGNGGESSYRAALTRMRGVMDSLEQQLEKD